MNENDEIEHNIQKREREREKERGGGGGGGEGGRRPRDGKHCGTCD